MHFRTMMGGAAVAFALSGCAGTATALSQAQQQSLQSLRLFNADASPRFSAYVTCVGADGSCFTAQRTFADWARARHISLRAVAPGDVPTGGGELSAPADAPVPYRLVVQFAPLIVPSFNVTHVAVSGAMDGGYTPPKVGYTATIQVFASATGKLLAELPVHAQRSADFKADAGSYIRDEVKALVAGLDPAYHHQ